MGHAYTIASYILANRRPIKEGDTIDGITDGRIDPNLQWKCHFEDSLVGPGRPALGIHMDEATSGQ